MNLQDFHVRLESPQNQLSWRGSLTAFAKENSLTPGQMFELYSQLEKADAAPLNAFGKNRYTLRREASTVGSRPTPTFGPTRYLNGA